jgi:predicted RNA methylase
VTGFDIDDDALTVAQENIKYMELTDEVDLFKADISQLTQSL